MEGKLRIGYVLARPVGASRLKRLRLSFLDPMDVVDVDKDLIGRAREAVGEFFILKDLYLFLYRIFPVIIKPIGNFTKFSIMNAVEFDGRTVLFS